MPRSVFGDKPSGDSLTIWMLLFRAHRSCRGNVAAAGTFADCNMTEQLAQKRRAGARA